jgi:hypothetical protein
MLTSPLANLVAFVLCIAGCVLAFAKGGASERIGAGVILANLVVATANYSSFGNQIADLCIDGLTATALLVLAIRYAAPWLGAAMLIFAVQFGLDAFYFVLERRPDHFHDLVNNADTLGVSICLAAGAILAWRRRTRAQAPAAPLAADGAEAAP